MKKLILFAVFCCITGLNYAQLSVSPAKVLMEDPSNIMSSANSSWGDIKGSDKLDFVLHGYDFEELKLLTDVNGELSYNSQSISNSSSPVYASALCDLDGDGDLDYLSGCAYDNYVYEWDNGKYEHLKFGETLKESLHYYYTNTIVTGDFTNDGKPDVIWIGPWGDACLSINSSTSTSISFESTTKLDFEIADITGGNNYARVADFNGDGNLDVVMGDRDYNDGNYGSYYQILWGDGNGNFTHERVESNGDGYFVLSVSPGDINKDGKDDFVITRTNSSTGSSEIILFVRNSANDGFDATNISRLSSSSYCVLLDDIDNDNNLDIIFQTYRTNYLNIMLNKGDGTFNSTPDLTFYTDVAYQYFLYDMDGLGNKEIVTIKEQSVEYYLVGVKPATPTADKISFTYDGTEKTPTVKSEANTSIVWYEDATSSTAISEPKKTTVGEVSVYAAAKALSGFESDRVEINFEITPKALTVSGASAADKVYDATNTATISGATLSGAITDDDVSLANATSGAFYWANVGNNIGITPNMVLQGDDKDNYTLTKPTLTASITKRELTVTGAVASNKEYDATKTASISGASLLGIQGSDVITLVNANSASFNSSDVADDIVITTSMTLSGTKVSNYELTQPSLKANITHKELTVNADANSKEYDASTTASISNVTLVGVVDGEDVSLSNATSANFTSSKVGNDIDISTAMTLIGTDIANYTLKQPSLSANITAKALSVSGTVAADKVYDATNTATLSGASLEGAISGDDVSLVNATSGTFSSVNVGNDIGIIPDMVLQGDDKDNYTLTKPTLTASITAKGVIVTVTSNQEKTYAQSNPDEYTFSCDDANAIFTGALIREIGEDAGNYSITQGSLAIDDNHYISSFVESDFIINPKELTVSNTVVLDDKLYDGSDHAEIIEQGTIEGIEATDIGLVSFTAIGAYTDSSPGNNKTIEVTYILSGAAAKNYNCISAIFNNAIIAPIIPPIASFNIEAICNEESINIEYDIIEGLPVEYQLTFDDAAKEAGFNDVAYTTLPSGDISISVPNNAQGGDYQVQLVLKDSYGVESDVYPLTIRINLAGDYIVSKFNDVLLFDNSSKRFITYQWYLNDEKIDGATEQFYSHSEGFIGDFSVEAIDADGNIFRTCNKYFDVPVLKSMGIKVYPNPIKANENFTIELSNIDTQELANAVLSIYSISGAKVYTTNQVSNINTARLAQLGEFIIIVRINDERQLDSRLVITQ